MTDHPSLIPNLNACRSTSVSGLGKPHWRSHSSFSSTRWADRSPFFITVSYVVPSRVVTFPLVATHQAFPLVFCRLAHRVSPPVFCPTFNRCDSPNLLSGLLSRDSPCLPHWSFVASPLLLRRDSPCLPTGLLSPRHIYFMVLF